MAKNKNHLPGLGGLTNNRKSSLAGAPGLANTTAPTGGSIRLGSSGGARKVGLGASGLAKSIDFGKPTAVQTAATAGTDWLQLINQATSNGVASLFGGGLNLTGIGSAISSIANLFGGHQKSLPTLTPFQLGPSQNEAITISGGTMTVSTQSIQDQSAQIAQAVKTAILHSSSLNDVLSEI